MFSSGLPPTKETDFTPSAAASMSSASSDGTTIRPCPGSSTQRLSEQKTHRKLHPVMNTAKVGDISGSSPWWTNAR